MTRLFDGRGPFGPLLALLVAVSLSQMACSTHYQPRPGHRLSIVMEGGQLAYHRNGETIGHGFFGSGVVEAVEDDPAAREAAETYRGRNVGGFVATTLGLVCFLGASTWAVSSDSSSDDFFNSERGSIFLGALGCLLAGSITGAVLFATAQPYHFDAINIYNDNAEARAYRVQPPFLPGGMPPPYAPPPPAGPAPGAPAPAPAAPPAAPPPTPEPR
jgi:hypothetical protein